MIRRSWLWRRVIGSLRILRPCLAESVGTRAVEFEQRYIIPDSYRSVHSADHRFVAAEDSRDHGLEEV